MQRRIKKKRSISQLSIHNRCENCLNEGANLYKTSVCRLHLYCESCINPSAKNLQILKNSSCNNCARYFNTLNKEPSEGSINCNLCFQMSSNAKPNCIKHSYCGVCKEFLIHNDTHHLLNFSKCEDCVTSLSQIKNPFIITPARSHPLEPESPDRMKKSIIKNEDDLIISMTQIVKKTELISFENPEHHEIELKKQYSHEEISKFRLSCHQGFETDQTKVIAFLCNHNNCYNCLIRHCAEEIIEFFQRYQIDANFLYKNVFSYKCINCNTNISVSTRFIVERLKQDLYHESFANHFDERFKFIITPNFEPWIPYFDGLNPYFIF